VASVILQFLALIVAVLAAYGVGWFARGRKLPAAHVDPVLAEAEAEVEALLSGLPPEERQKKRLALEAPKRRMRKHPTLSQTQVKAIVGLLADGFSTKEIEWMLVDGVDPPTGGVPANASHWSGGAYSDGSRTGCKGKWGPAKIISPLTWAYLVRVIEKRPRPKFGWVFQGPNGYSLDRGDILVCSPVDDVND
jgi:hypothetical protein